MKRSASISILILLLAGGAVTVGAAAQDVERIRTLYVAAAYEEALAAIPPSAPSAMRLEVEQYRALCLLALGRDGEAVTVVEAIVGEHPAYTPSSSEFSPRIRALFAEARVRLVPSIARQAYADGKAAFEAGRHTAARDAFSRVMATIDSLPQETRGELADLRLLANGFLDLATARIAPAPPPLPLPEVPTLATAYEAPIAIEERLPPWNPPDAASRRTEYVGVLRIQIGADGQVASVEVVKASHPAYDVAAVRAAQAWTYRPATRNGDPVPAAKEIQIRLVPQ